MSLETLLEAAEFIEWSAHSKPRDDEIPEGEIMTFIKTETLADGDGDGDDGDSSYDDSMESQRGFGDDFKDKRRAGGAGTRETHNKLEKNRRAHLKECFDVLKVQVPYMEDKKTSNLSILRGALKFIQNLKRKEKELEKDLNKLASEKSKLREKIAKLKVDLAKLNMDVDLTKWMPVQEQETYSTSTASGAGSPIISDTEEDKLKKAHRKHKHSSKDIGPQNQMPILKNIPVCVIQPNSTPLPTFTSSVVSPTATPTMATHIRAPVTQLLHQTLSKRQALQKQREQLAGSQASSQTSVPAVMNQLLRQQLSYPVSATPLPVTKLVTSTMNIPLPQSTKGYPSNQLQTITTTTSVPNSNMATYTTTATISSPRIVPATSVHGLSHMSTLTALSHLTAVAGIGHATTDSSSVLSPSLSGLPSNLHTSQMITTMVTPSVSSLASMSAIKPILATPPTTHLLSGHLALNPLITQIPRSNTVLTAMTTQTGTTTGQPQLVSLAHMGALTPMTVIPQGIQMTGLSAAQFNTMMSPHHILKQFPILQPPLLHQMQQGQVIGQPMVKPVVMVSLPNVVTSGTSTSMNIATTS